MRFSKALLTMLAVSLLAPALAIATPPAGVVSNVILAQGATTGPMREHITRDNNWAVRLESEGDSEFYVQDLVVGPKGYTGWHSHPGLLMITVKEGAIDFYDQHCLKRTYAAGQSFIEAAEPHNAMNSSPHNARLLVAYIIKKGEPRRLEAPQPKCGETLGIP